MHFVFESLGEQQIIFDIETIVGNMMYRVNDEVDNDNEDVEENLVFDNEDE
jgi:hypothetical protein